MTPFSSPELIQRARKQIRARMRALRDAYPESARSERSRRIVERISELELYRAARSIGLYFPLAGEVDLRALDAKARAEGKQVFYPFMEPNESGGYTTGLALVHSLDELEVRGHRFPEPPRSAPQAKRGDVDVVVVPALAVSITGHRLGYGSGFYDVTLPDFCPPASPLVVAFDFQLLGEIPTLEHDVPCATIVTDARVVAGCDGSG